MSYNCYIRIGLRRIVLRSFRKPPKQFVKTEGIKVICDAKQVRKLSAVKLSLKTVLVMVGLPPGEGREKLLRTLLAKEKLGATIDFKELATMTRGFSGNEMKTSAQLLLIAQ